MKYTAILLLVILSILGHANAQSVIATAGKTISNNNIQLEFTIGEPLVSSFEEGDIKVSSGFLSVSPISGTTTGTKVNSAAQWKVFPNPTTNILTIENKGISAQNIFSVYSISGKLMKQGQVVQQEQIDLQSFPDGLYILHVFDSNTLQTESFKIEKISR